MWEIGWVDRIKIAAALLAYVTHRSSRPRLGRDASSTPAAPRVHPIAHIGQSSARSRVGATELMDSFACTRYKANVRASATQVRPSEMIAPEGIALRRR
jgi:hypothetical protein